MSGSRIIRGQVIRTAADVGNDAVTCFGPGETIIEDCVIDFRALSPDEQDEGISGVCGARVVLRRCLLLGCKKALLAGNGDHPEEDAAGAEWLIEDCVLLECGRRCPEAQDGTKVTMRRCWIHDWGNRFDERAFGAWARTGAYIYAEDCLFTQSGGRFSLGLWCTLKDVFSHVGQAVSMYGIGGIFRARSWLPGVCRGLTADEDGRVKAVRCYRNKSWIRIDGCESYIDEEQATLLIKRLPPSRDHLGESLLEIWESL